MKPSAEMTTAELLSAYAAAAQEHGECTARGDYKRGNTLYKVIDSAYKELKRRGGDDFRSLTQLLAHPDSGVRLWAASHSLEIATEAGEAVLRDLATNVRGPNRLAAEMVLEQWSEGTLSFP